MLEASYSLRERRIAPIRVKVVACSSSVPDSFCKASAIRATANASSGWVVPAALDGGNRLVPAELEQPS